MQTKILERQFSNSRDTSLFTHERFSITKEIKTSRITRSKEDYRNVDPF